MILSEEEIFHFKDDFISLICEISLNISNISLLDNKPEEAIEFY